MDDTFLVVFITALFVVLVVLRVPIALALASAGVVGLFVLGGTSMVVAAIGGLPYQATANYSLVILPMFILMGVAALRSGLTKYVFEFAYVVLHRLPGGLALASVGACGLFAAITGSSLATVASVGKVAIAEMTRFGYKSSFAAGTVAAAGTLGVLIPPSIILVLYGILTGESIGALLLAGILPGTLSAFVYAIAIVYRVRRSPALVGSGANPPRPPAGGPSPADLPSVPLALRVAHVTAIGRIVLLFMIVVGGIYAGFFTATESAAIGAAVAVVLLLFSRGDEPAHTRLAAAFRESASLTSMLFFILVGASIFSFFLVRSGVPVRLASGLATLEVPAWLIVIIILVAFTVMGMFLEPYSLLVVGVPLTYPTVVALGFDGIWFGILVVKCIELGLITPPIGLNAYVVSAVSESVTVEDAFRGLGPYALLDALTIALLFLAPSIVLFLPSVAPGT